MLVCVGACQCSKSVGFRGVGIVEHACILGSGEEGREIERAQKGARSPPVSGARARGEMDAGGLACAAIANCSRTFFQKTLKANNVGQERKCRKPAPCGGEPPVTLLPRQQPWGSYLTVSPPRTLCRRRLFLRHTTFLPLHAFK